ncbi:hypothetical protein JAO29_15475 [Edaphobacter sp. HDX4]|uniref:LAGLIDADG family homing endonuclease n=1 Tax=Edaphobacter sp. HDX4 TaxID=2794064 RepID=UPI002FE668BB
MPLKHPPKNIVQPEPGPTLSHCIAADQLIISSHGLKYVGEIFTETGIGATCTNKNTPMRYPLFNRHGEAEHTSALTNNGSRSLFHVVTRSGLDIKATASQKLLTIDEAGWWVWKKLSDITPGHHLTVNRSYGSGIGVVADLSYDELYFVGVTLADGHLGWNRILLCNDDPVVQSAIVNSGTALIGKEPRIYARPGKTKSLGYYFNSKVGVERLYELLGWKRCNAAGKVLGPVLRRLNRDGIRAVLQGYFDCECSIDGSVIEVSSASKKLLSEVKVALLVHFGIVSILKEKSVSKYPEKEYWRLMLYGAEAESFLTNVGFRSEIRKKACDGLRGVKRNPNLDSIPNVGGLISAVCNSSEVDRALYYKVRDYMNRNTCDRTPNAKLTYQRLAEILAESWAKSLALERLREIYVADYYYDEVISVTPMPAEPTFDFTMPLTNSYVLNGVVSRGATNR